MKLIDDTLRNERIMYMYSNRKIIIVYTRADKAFYLKIEFYIIINTRSSTILYRVHNITTYTLYIYIFILSICVKSTE